MTKRALMNALGKIRNDLNALIDQEDPPEFVDVMSEVLVSASGINNLIERIKQTGIETK